MAASRTFPLLPLACAAGLAGCVTLGGIPMVKDAVGAGQRTLLVVYASPGPVMKESDSNINEAAKIIPGLSLIIQATQDKRDRDASESLRRLLGPWDPTPMFYPLLQKKIAGAGYPGVFVTPEQAEVSPQQLKRFNQAKHIIDWQVRYSGNSKKHPIPRNYSTLPQLRGALVLEIDLSYGVPSDGEGHWAPNLSAVTKLFRVNDMALLWRHENSVADKAGMANAVDFRAKPKTLLRKWEALMPELAQAISVGLAANLQAAAAR